MPFDLPAECRPMPPHRSDEILPQGRCFQWTISNSPAAPMPPLAPRRFLPPYAQRRIVVRTA